MLAYRHLFHAGNFADVFKHALLTQLVLGLQKKDKPFFVLDTHAGIGTYDLTDPWAQKNAEYKDGIALLWERKDAPNTLVPYLEAVRAENVHGTLRFYPGSPRIVRRLLRPNDRLVLIELNRKDCEELEALFRGDRQVMVRLMDGYQALRAFLPPKERRGLVFIDSSFDRAQEFKRLTEGLVEAYRRFETGVYALWYPLMEPTAMRAFERGVMATDIRKVLQLELSVMPDDWAGNLRGCGLLVVNPPFGFAEIARSILAWLWPVLSQDRDGGHGVKWLVEE
ncbi:MAG TPA: 23S rRNA (adenine(2030)-N(6))-methyltransferase RlmJ [Burkholderiales bacterium]|jgi:23S rRNA (adenine2030-N6)-methyltransferase|nr:23S rRNA (adenine(2030)-N(6))-methyltransferase RlmJ [Burkholderiales bacterium]